MNRPKGTLVSLFLLAMAVLMMEVCLTRVFSVISWHHFAYLIIAWPCWASARPAAT